MKTKDQKFQQARIEVKQAFRKFMNEKTEENKKEYLAKKKVRDQILKQF